MAVTNLDIAELLARRSEETEGQRARAYRRASRAALGWHEEAAALLAGGRSLTELYGIGTKLAGRIEAWIEEEPEIEERPPKRSGFITMAVARTVLEGRDDWRRRLRGDLQMHTTHSDGAEPVAAMVAEGIERDYDYVAITDHSKLRIANGMNEEQLGRQLVEIDELNADLEASGGGFRVLKALEMNLDMNGDGDMSSEVLAPLDLVLGSFHSQLRKTEDQTARYLGAVTNPDVTVLGHCRGRIYNTRQGLFADWPRVFAVAAEAGTAVEVDCFPDRQDVNVELLEIVRDAGCYISIGTDAHNRHEMSFIDVGLATTLLVDFPPDRILNFMSADEIATHALTMREAKEKASSR
jgi:putative hydrolase